MPKALEIYDSLAAALPENADAREELIAVGMVATGIISAVPHEDRAELVDKFCKTLRLGVAGELHS